MEANKKYLIIEMTSEEAEKAITKSDFVVLPTGSIEQHSKHLPLSTDSILAEMLTKHLAENSEDLRFVVLPTLCFGISEHHIHFPGTITLQTDTYQRVIYEIGWSLKQHGVKRFLIINFHGGNIEPIKLARLRLERELRLKTYYIDWGVYCQDIVKKSAGRTIYGHSGLLETSLMLFLRPDLVRKEKMQKQEQTRPDAVNTEEIYDEKLQASRPVTRVFPYFEENWPTGGLGDPTIASVEFARELIDKETKRIEEALKKDMKYET